MVADAVDAGRFARLTLANESKLLDVTCKVIRADLRRWLVNTSIAVIGKEAERCALGAVTLGGGATLPDSAFRGQTPSIRFHSRPEWALVWLMP